jgi:FixJ family two-component response regulator
MKFRSNNGYKRIAILDEDKDVTTTFQMIQESGLTSKGEIALRLTVYSSNSPEQFLADFEPDFYDLLLFDINLPGRHRFELSKRLLEIDLNLRFCFMAAGVSVTLDVQPLVRSDV